MSGYKNGVVSVGTTATLIASIGSAPENGGVVVQNNGSVAVFVGGPTVTATGATAGPQIAANGTLTIPTTGAEPLSLYGVVASATANVSYIYPG
jgi:hypothetical protein